MTAPDETPPSTADPRLDEAERALEASATPATTRSNAFEREADRRENRAEARDADDGASTAARLAGVEAAQADTERIEAEATVARLRARAPGSPQLADAEEALARIESDAKDAIDASLDSGMRAADAVGASRRWHEDGPAAEAAYGQAEADLHRVGQDLADADAQAARIAADAEKAGDG
jgi:hypothetical protein